MHHTRIKANGLLFAAAYRNQSTLESSCGGFFTLALVQEMMAKSGETLADAFGHTVAITQRMTENRQTPEAVGDIDLARHILFRS